MLGSFAPSVDGEAATRDGRRLHFERHGTGAPVVVCEAGMGFSRNAWGAVIPLVAPHTAVVAYDRSGLGQSPADSAGRDLARLSDDLLDLLDHLAAESYVLVGHSWGGPIVRSAAARTPDRIAGLILVDQTDEGCDLFFSKAAQRQQRVGRIGLTVAARTGLLRRVVRKHSSHVPEPWATAMRAEDGTTTSLNEQFAELLAWPADLRRLRDEPLTLPEVPVTVISGGRAGFMEKRRRDPLIAAHRASAGALPQGRHVIADRSGHYVPLTEPDLIATEVLRLVEMPVESAAEPPAPGR